MHGVLFLLKHIIMKNVKHTIMKNLKDLSLTEEKVIVDKKFISYFLEDRVKADVNDHARLLASFLETNYFKDRKELTDFLEKETYMLLLSDKLEDYEKEISQFNV